MMHFFVRTRLSAEVLRQCLMFQLFRDLVSIFIFVFM